MIGHKTNTLADARSSGPLGIAPSIPSFAHSEFELEATNIAAPPELQPLQSVPSSAQEVITNAGGSASGFPRASTVSKRNFIPLVLPVSPPFPRSRCINDTLSQNHPVLSRSPGMAGGSLGLARRFLRGVNDAYSPAVPIPFAPGIPVGTKSVGSQHSNSSPTPDLDDMVISQPYVEIARSIRPSLPLGYQWLVPDDVEIVGGFPIAAGGFSDIYEAIYDGCKVALKSYRIYTSFDVTQVVAVSCNRDLCQAYC